MKDALALLRIRNFGLLFGARCVSFLGNAMAPVALAFAILELTGSASALGIVLAARTVPQLIFLLVGGVIADRLPRHLVLVGSNVVAGASQMLVAVLLISGAAELWQVIILEAINGAAAALFYPADSSVVPSTVPEGRLQHANAVLRLGSNIALIAGAGLAAILVAAFNPGWAIAVDAMTFLIGASLNLGMRGIEAAATAAQSMFADLKEGWNEFRAHRWLWTIVVQFSVVLAAFLGGYNVLGPVVAERHMNGASSWAIIVGAESVGAFLGGFLAIRWRPARPILVATITVFGMALPLVFLAIAAHVAVVAIASVVQGVGMELFMVYWYTALQEQVAPESLARVNSYDALGSMALAPLGMAVAGPVADWLGVATALWIDVAVIVAATAAVLLVPEVRGLRSKAPAPARELSPLLADGA
jgi:MFS family permease